MPFTYHVAVKVAEEAVRPADLRDVLASLRKSGAVTWWRIKVNVVVIKSDRDLDLLLDGFHSE